MCNCANTNAKYVCVKDCKKQHKILYNCTNLTNICIYMRECVFKKILNMLLRSIHSSLVDQSGGSC